MNFQYAHRFVHPERCFVCRWAERQIVFWPQEPSLRPSDGQGAWHGYIKAPNVRGVNNVPRSGHKTITVCTDHWHILEEDWIKVASDEVELANLWDRYIERIEA